MLEGVYQIKTSLILAKMKKIRPILAKSMHFDPCIHECRVENSTEIACRWFWQSVFSDRRVGSWLVPTLRGDK